MFSNPIDCIGTREVELEGVIRPMNWDRLGLVRGYIFCSLQGEDYPIIGHASEFYDILNQRVKITGEIRQMESGLSILRIERIIGPDLTSEKGGRVARGQRPKRLMKFNEQTHAYSPVKKTNTMTPTAGAGDLEFDP
jgi:hypothetical protein